MFAFQNLRIASTSPAEESEQVVGIPRKNPRVQQRVAEIPRDIAGQTGGERPGEYESDAKIQQRRFDRGREGPRALHPLPLTCIQQ